VQGRAVDVDRTVDDYTVEKIFEDDSGVLPGSTVVIHDVKTGRYFFGGVMSPFITICESASG
jgi:arylesterase/paraoxonase